MKSKFFISLLLASAISSGFAEVSTLAQRATMVNEAFTKSPEEALKAINESQQGGKITTDDQDYVVIVKKQGSEYIRVAHSKKDKLDKPIEPVLVDVMTKAEEKLAGGSGPVDYEFSAGERKMYAVIEKRGDYLIFNICPTKAEMEGFLKATQPTEVTTSSSAPASTVPEVKKEEPKAESVTPAEVKKEEPTVAPETTTPVNALASASIAPAATVVAEETPRVHQ